MKKITFVSGWAGYPDLFPDLAKKSNFMLPFVDLSEQQIRQKLSSPSSPILMGWSTGAHIILKDLEKLKNIYEYIIFIAPFTNFTSHVPLPVLQKMMLALQRSPETTVHSFYRKCHCPLRPTINLQDKKKLEFGLEFLQKSQVKELKSNIYNLSLIQGIKDKIVPNQSSIELHKLTGCSKYLLPNQGHWIQPEKLKTLVHEITGKKFL